MSFIHLNVASAYSLKYGTTQPGDLVERAAQFEMPALALTDRDGLAGAIRFAQSCVDFGIAPIIGVNLAVDMGGTNNRLTLMAHSDGGWRSLCRLLTSLAMTSDSRNPVLTLDFLQRFSHYSTNVYALHGPHSLVGSLITDNRIDAAYAAFNQSRDLFADNAIEC
ncbi:MAG: PHP domain-containing protein, partial [Actinobacteria bacterium]|nr:PHP domain-containing protein [Actinomycetota bacterium]